MNQSKTNKTMIIFNGEAINKKKSKLEKGN